MFILYDYKCTACEHEFESLEKRGTETVACPECSGPSNKLISAVRCKLDGVSGDFPGAALKWERAHR